MEKYSKLIAILLDKSIPLAERDDAAMDLSTFDEDSVLQALIKIAKDNREDEIILASCGESIAEILLRRNIDSTEIVQQLAQPARNEAEALIRAKSFS